MKLSRDFKVIEAILFASSEPVSDEDLKNKIINKDNFNSYMLDMQKF